MNEAALKRLEQEMTPKRFVLENGLTVLVCEMPQFKGVHAVYATRFGSATSGFELDGETVMLPDGVAHFLEHKMFEDEDGNDAFELYAQTGASANAFTSFDKTCYIFTATAAVEESLDILLDFVSHPYFTEKTVAKEQGIIGQEIKMYDDSPEFRMMFGLLAALYHNCPVRTDIAGTVESIAQITPELLYKCCDAFYCPQNMVLSVAGNITAQQVLDACARADIPANPHKVRRIEPQEPAGVLQKEVELTMQVAQPIWGIGYKAAPNAAADARGELICDLVTELLVGDTSPLYRRLYDSGLINAGFSGEYVAGEGYCTLIFGGETRDPAALQAEFLAEVRRVLAEGIDREQFACTKNLMLGEAIMGLESIEDVAADQAAVWLKNHTLFDEIRALAALTPEDVENALPALLCEEYSATIRILPPV